MSDKEIISVIVQNFCQKSPLIIWGSGATIPFGMPSMDFLNNKLIDKIPTFDNKSGNLEEELTKDKYHDQLENIRDVIWNVINEADKIVLHQNLLKFTHEFSGIMKMLSKFFDTHPHILNIITTNYDCILEYVLSFMHIPYSDGFNGKVLSVFDQSEFKNKNIVNILKVHGSLNWFQIGTEIRFFPYDIVDKKKKIIIPGNAKYKDSFDKPYRDLIHISDDYIMNSNCFLVVGFGFNDEHLTPNIINKVNNGTPIILITKKISKSCFLHLKNAQKYILFEESENDKTRVRYKNGNRNEGDVIIDGDLWSLNSFMELI